ncbi:MAG: carotenoid biosynthesis protein [Patescibacteria group bacterium]|nr:carotenoid biosynthesis protein [Patescibacteria group bacterium]
MKKTKKARFATFLFAILFAVMAWASYSLLINSFSVTSYWGVGIGFTLALFFVFVILGRSFGYTRALLATLAITVVISLALILNSTRGWPFGIAYYHGILGWKFYNVAWPIPVLWGALVTGFLMLKKPKRISPDPKVLFSWAFDTALLTMLASLVIEPLAKSTLAVTWVSGGSFLGVPMSAFLGWFIVSFTASVVAIIILKPWQNDFFPAHYLLPLSLTCFSLLMFIFSTQQNIVLIQFLSAIGIIIFFIWTLRFKTLQNKALLLDQNL